MSTTTELAAHSPSPPARATRRPDVFIVGAPKCGTTTLHAYLGDHPEVFMCSPKEPNYFMEPSCRLVKDEADYLALFDGAGDALRAGEATPWYLYLPDVPAAIREFNPEARVIIMVRQPADFMASLHNHQLQALHGEDIVDFRRALEAEDDRRQGRRLPPGLELPPYYLFYRDVARFSVQVERYLDAFGPDCVHVVLFDEFVSKPQEEFERVCRFLGVRDGVPIRPRNANPARQWRSRVLAHTLQRVPAPLLAIGKLVPPDLRHRVRDGLWKLNASSGYKARSDQELRRELTLEFAPEIRRLGELIGRDLSHWCEA